MTRVTLLHNVSEPLALTRMGETPACRSNDPLEARLVIELPDASDPELLNEAFALGNDAHARSLEYRALRVRSLSVGDAVEIEGRVYSCDSYGWTRLR